MRLSKTLKWKETVARVLCLKCLAFIACLKIMKHGIAFLWCSGAFENINCSVSMELET